MIPIKTFKAWGGPKTSQKLSSLNLTYNLVLNKRFCNNFFAFISPRSQYFLSDIKRNFLTQDFDYYCKEFLYNRNKNLI